PPSSASHPNGKRFCVVDGELYLANTAAAALKKVVGSPGQAENADEADVPAADESSPKPAYRQLGLQLDGQLYAMRTSGDIHEIVKIEANDDAAATETALHSGTSLRAF